MTKENHDRSLAILMGTYNGERFIQEQMESIQNQTYQTWRLIIRDDGSSDRTLQIIKKFAAEDPRIELLQDQAGNLGPCQNFGRLAQYAYDAGYTYFAFSDQDDVWKNDKLELSLDLAKQAEKTNGNIIPTLLHTDIEIVDESLNRIHASHMQYRGIHHISQDAINTLLVQNVVTGCSMLCNRALLDTALPIPPQAIMHDWWLALCASLYGKIVYTDKTTLYYRQHEKNQIGAKIHRPYPNPFRRGVFTKWKNGLQHFEKKISQAKALNELAEETSTESPKEFITLKNFLAIFEANSVLKRGTLALRAHLNTQKGLVYQLLMLSYIIRAGKHQ